MPKTKQKVVMQFCEQNGAYVQARYDRTAVMRNFGMTLTYHEVDFI